MPNVVARFACAAAIALAACRTPPPATQAPPVPSHAAAAQPPAGKADPTLVAAAAGTPSLRPGYVRPKLIDFHGHLSPDGLDRIAQVMADNGIETMVNLSGGSQRRGTAALEGSKAMADALQGAKAQAGSQTPQILNFWSPDWHDFGVAGWGEREAGRLQEAVDRFGFRGVKISKGLGLGYTDAEDRLVPVDDARIGPVWQKAGDLGIPVCIHVADPRAFWQPLTPQNERWDELGTHPYWAYGPVPPELAAQMPERPPVPSWQALLQSAERLYRNHPRTTFVAVHFANAAEDLDYVDGLLQRNPNLWIDIAARVGEFGRHPPEKLRAFFSRHQDRIVFGTDIGIGADGLMLGSNGPVEPTMADVAPFFLSHFRFFETGLRQIDHPSPIQGRWKIDAIDLPNDVLDKVYRGNALRALDRRGRLAWSATQPGASPPLAEVPSPGPTPPLPVQPTPSASP